MSGWLAGSLSSIGGKLTEITREVLNETPSRPEGVSDSKESASVSGATSVDRIQYLELELKQANHEIAELKERNADLNQQLELSELQVQQITDKYKSHVEKKLEHETVRRGGLSVSSMDSDGGLEYENRQLKDQITTLKCEVAHWKEVLKAQESTLQSQNAGSHSQLELEITLLRREIDQNSAQHQTELFTLQQNYEQKLVDLQNEFAKSESTALLQETNDEWGNWGADQNGSTSLVEELKERVTVLEEENKNLSASLEDLDKEHQAAIALVVEAKNAAINQYKEALADLAESRDAYNRLVESSADGQADHESSVTIVNESDGAEIQLLTTKNNELSAENKELSARLEQLTNENRELNEAYLDMNEKLEKRQTETLDATASNRELSRKLENLKGDLIEYEEKYEKCKQENQRAMRQLENLTSEFDKLKNDVSSARLSNENGTKYFHDEITRLTDELQDSLGKREKLVDDLQEFQQMSEHFHTQLQRLKVENKNLAEANAEMARQLEAVGSFKDVFNETEEELQLLRISLKNFQLEYLKKEKQLREELQDAQEENSRLRLLNKDLRSDNEEIPSTPANTITPSEVGDERSTLIEAINLTEKALSEERNHSLGLSHQLEAKIYHCDQLESQLKEAILHRRHSSETNQLGDLTESTSVDRRIYLDREAAIAALNERNRILQQELDDLKNREMRQGSTIAVLRQQSQEQTVQSSGLTQLIEFYRRHVGPEVVRQIEAIPHHLVAQLTPGAAHRMPKAIGYHSATAEDVVGGSETGSSGDLFESRGNESPRSDPEGWNQDIEWPNSNGSEPSGDTQGHSDDGTVENAAILLSESCEPVDYMQQVVFGRPLSAEMRSLTAAEPPTIGDSEEETLLKANLETVKTQLSDLLTAHNVAELQASTLRNELREALSALTEKTEECQRLQTELSQKTKVISEKDGVLHQAYDELKSLELNLEAKVSESERSREQLESLKKENENLRTNQSPIDVNEVLLLQKERDDLVSANYELTSLRQQVEAAATDWKALVAAQNELSLQRQQFVDLTTERDSLALQVDRVNEKEKEMQRMLVQRDQALKECQDESSKLTHMKNDMAAQNQEMAEQLAKCQEELRSHKAIVADKQLQLESQTAQLTQLHAELNELRLLHQSTVAAQEKEKADLSAQLDASVGERQQLMVYLNQKHDESLQYYQEMQRLAGLLTSSEEKVAQIEQKLLKEESLQQKTVGANENSAMLIEQLNEQLAEAKRAIEEKNSAFQLLEDKYQQISDKLVAKEALVKQLGADISSKELQITNLVEQGSSELQQQLSLATQHKSRAVAELEKERERNGGLVQQIKIVEEREIRVNKELERLRAHLLQVEENYTKELTQAENRCQYLQGQLVNTEDKLSTTAESAKGLSGRLQSENADLKTQLQSIAAQRDSLTLQITEKQEELEKTAKSLANLQQVLQHFQQDKDSRTFDEVEKYKKEVKQLQSEKKQNNTKIAQLEAELEAMAEEIQSVLSFKQQLRAKDDTLERMRHQVEEADLKNSELQAKLSEQKKVQDSKIEKDLIKSLLLGYFQAPANKKVEVAHLLGSVLGFSSDEFKKLDGSSSSGWLNFLRAGSIPAAEGQAQSRSDEQSLTQQFVKFLETESTPKPSPHSLATGEHRFPTLNPPNLTPSITDNLLITPTRYQQPPSASAVSGQFHYESSAAASRSSTPGGITFTAPSHASQQEATATFNLAAAMKDTNPLLVRLAPPSDRGRVSPGNSATFTSAWLAEKPSESSATMTLTSGAEQTPKVSAEILKNVLNSAN